MASFKSPRAYAVPVVVVFAAASVGRSQSWVAQGPGPSQFGQVEGNAGGTMALQNRPVNGGVQAVIAHPSDANRLWIFTTNGGLWRTTNATSLSPTWTPLTENLVSLAGQSLEFDPTDGTSNTMWAGVGLRSSFGSVAGQQRSGLLRSTDGGTNWTPVNSGIFGQGIAGVAPRGGVITMATDFSDANTYATVGVFRSTNGGVSFAQISSGNGAATGLPGGRAWTLASDPNNSNVLYTAVTFASGVGGANGLYRSADSGASWTKVSDAALDAKLTDSVNNVKISIGTAGQVFVGTVNSGVLNGIFRSSTGTGAWTSLDVPQTVEGSSTIGTHPGPQIRGGSPPPPMGVPMDPNQDAGSQGGTHFSLIADPNDANIVYIGGDRQPLYNEGGVGPQTFPNSLGANDFSGRLFRVNASLPAGTQARSLTHLVGVSTTDNSAPHADSRDMVFDANGHLIEADDGGIYRRTNPSGLGAWSSVGGNLQAGEFHSADWDRNSDVIVGGTQDIGTPEQVTPGGLTWRSVSNGDGGKVAIDDRLTGTSTRYTSFQRFGGFNRRTVNASNVVLTQTYPATNVPALGTTILGIENNDPGNAVPFYTPVIVNGQNGSVIVGGARRVYESSDQGQNFTIRLTLADVNGVQITALAAGSANNPNALWAGSNLSGSFLSSRSAPGSMSNVASYPGSTVRDISLDPADFMRVAVADSDQFFYSSNGGTSFSDITGNMLSFVSVGVLSIRSTETIIVGTTRILLAGLATGDVLFTDASSGGAWSKLADLPNAPVLDLAYDATDDVLVAATLGRGVFTFDDVSMTLVPEPATAAGAMLLISPMLLRRRR